MEPEIAIALCVDAHRRLMATATHVDDATARRPSRLPGWTVAHVVTHLARNADGHARRLEGALRGAEVPRYPGGSQQRDREIEAGAQRSANELVHDLEESATRLEQVWTLSNQAGWPNAQLLAADTFPTTGSPVRRLREVEVHHVDLGLGYEATDWPAEYVRWELPMALARVPDRLTRPEDAQRLLAWLTGRASSIDGIELRPWM
ncbi:MAG: maleylpyruvate isomerase family mycothiol-dependent enzyme [Candidatus Dormiibacterota bacterium]